MLTINFTLNLLNNVFYRVRRYTTVYIKNALFDPTIINLRSAHFFTFFLTLFASFIFLYFRTGSIRLQHPLPAFIPYYNRSV